MADTLKVNTQSYCVRAVAILVPFIVPNAIKLSRAIEQDLIG